MKDIYPLTIVKDRYGGTYSGAEYLAFNKHPWQIDNDDAFADDVSCAMFWEEDHRIGLGSSPDSAINDLKRKMDQK